MYSLISVELSPPNGQGKFCQEKRVLGVTVVAQQVKKLISIHEVIGLIAGLAQWVKELPFPQAAV